MTIRDILARKEDKIYSITESAVVYEVIKMLVENNIGAVIVRNEKGEVSGIISERDILREGYRNCEKLKEITVGSVMTSELIVGEPDDPISYAEQVMVQNSIRHLPIIENKRLVGVVSMRDIVRGMITTAEVENRYLTDYITGKYPA